MSPPVPWPPEGCPPIEDAMKALHRFLRERGLTIRVVRVGDAPQLWVDMEGWSFRVSDLNRDAVIETYSAPAPTAPYLYFEIHTKNVPVVSQALLAAGLHHNVAIGFAGHMVSMAGPWKLRERYAAGTPEIGKMAAELAQRGITYVCHPWPDQWTVGT